ncbi:BrxA/BrxB family bacilliredoxin [Candidatus Sumerlaeota bacterium]|nr:BrxA/BrxB family bacilliredoxin [Candidatus Sumerlaeota bacterium]
MKQHPNYDPEAVRPMWEGLVAAGFEYLTEEAQVHEALSNPKGTTLLIINSVCGCAAGNARPGAISSLWHDKIPDRLITVFAGMDHEAVARARSFLYGVAPSSPCIAVFKDGEAHTVLERRHLEQMTEKEITRLLTQIYDAICTRPGPAIPVAESEQANR